jgi:hypothetical protein
MISMTAAQPLPAQGDIQTLTALAALLADPAAAKARIEEFHAAAAEAAEAIDEANKANADVTELRARTEALLAEAKQKQDTALLDERVAHQEAIRAEREEVAADRKAAADLKAKAQADADEAARIRADLERRIRLVTAA